MQVQLQTDDEELKPKDDQATQVEKPTATTEQDADAGTSQTTAATESTQTEDALVDIVATQTPLAQQATANKEQSPQEEQVKAAQAPPQPHDDKG